MRLVWRGRALNVLKAIVSYIAERNVAAARRLQEDIEACAERLPDHPFMYRRGRVAGTREAVVHPNYILVYQVGRDALEIVSVMHSRRSYS
ncbi:addiction module toxin, RelE/StbE family [Sphingomonas sp. OV641]|uniref:type II toxin-antitoxin system RelE/ParE family toxin n=1 Tax=Sphingomonas sp. OV641 TaxID=1881068 RepID=UPI0008BB67B9|nr:type II toxin-antitoxin system RelE/ParE family toxin [Sphingomonas sp. OV641]SEI86196.1 addiction module toxin, RelE/StbE family [Sphingomonas sp. OV641]